MIPLTEAIQRALANAFPQQAITDVRPLHGGRSGATLLSFRVEGSDYVLRQSDPARFMHDARAHREIVCMMHASERGVAPRIHSVDSASNIAIMEKIEPAPLGRRSPGAPGFAERLERLARTLRALHEGPPSSFPRGMTTTDFVNALDQNLRAQGRVGLPSSLVDALGELEAPMKRFAATAPCHKDLNPGNVLETADRVYFIDWEAASASDPFFDLGSLSVFSFPTAEGREALLRSYLGRDPSVEERDRAVLARGMALGFCAATFLHLCLLAKGDARLPPPLPMLALLAGMGDPAGPPGPDVIAASLLDAMHTERTTDSFRAAKGRLTAAA